MLSCLCMICGSFLLFYAINFYMWKLVPKCASKTPKQKWKWTNTAVSFLHSSVTGILSLLSFYIYPDMGQDLINYYKQSSALLISFSIGYFIYDFVDMGCNHRKRSSYELMIHHIFVILCFGLSVMTKHYIGYSLVALVIEVHNIFLHTRQLLIIMEFPKSDQYYRINALLNIATFIVIRISVLGWMTRWLVLHRDDLSLPVYTLGSVGLAVIILMSIVLFIRVFSVDFGLKRSRDIKSNSETSHKFEEDSSLIYDVPNKALTASATLHIE